MKPSLSLIIPTHNPKLPSLTRVLQAIEDQTLDRDNWEVIVVDSASMTPLSLELFNTDLPIILTRLEEPGLTKARMAGIGKAQGETIIFIDDDNLIQPNYLEVAHEYMSNNSHIGCCGGIVEGEFEIPPPVWTEEFYSNLAVVNYGESKLVAQHENRYSDRVSYPKFAPVGAGMVLRKECASIYIKAIEQDPNSIHDRIGNELTSGGDCEIVVLTLKSGYQIAYNPDLKIRHLIPKEKISSHYLGRLLYGISRSWVLLLHKYDSCPWPASHPWLGWLKKLRTFIRHKAFLGEANWVRWRESCGYIDGRGDIFKSDSVFDLAFALPKQLGFGKLLYYSFHSPKKKISKLLADGFVSAYEIRSGEAAMRKSAKNLKLPECSEPTRLSVHILTGNKYWHQTLFCLYSLSKQNDACVESYIYDDGSLTTEQKNILKSKLPRTIIIDLDTIQETLSSVLPENDFPTLNRLRKSYPHIRKLTDIHTQPGEKKLVLDSDMLFFKKPLELIKWQSSGTGAVFLKDIETSYGYPIDEMKKLTKSTILDKVNVGVIGMPSKIIDWHEVEHWCQVLIDKFGTHYCLEQAISAMLVARCSDAEQLNHESYIVCPSNLDVADSKTILHHYVDNSKQLYLSKAWKYIYQRADLEQ